MVLGAEGGFQSPNRLAGRRRTDGARASAQQQSFAAARKLFSQSPSQVGNRPAELA
jgi:hypothetical protein